VLLKLAIYTLERDYPYETDDPSLKSIKIEGKTDG